MLKRLQVLRSEKGFTLVELLVVVTILGVLSAVAVIAVGGSTADSEGAACKADVATIQAASDAYAAGNDGDYALTPAALVTADYLRSEPTSDNVFSINATTGAVTSDPACPA